MEVIETKFLWHNNVHLSDGTVLGMSRRGFRGRESSHHASQSFSTGVFASTSSSSSSPRNDEIIAQLLTFTTCVVSGLGNRTECEYDDRIVWHYLSDAIRNFGWSMQGLGLIRAYFQIELRFALVSHLIYRTEH